MWKYLLDLLHRDNIFVQTRLWQRWVFVQTEVVPQKTCSFTSIFPSTKLNFWKFSAEGLLSWDDKFTPTPCDIYETEQKISKRVVFKIWQLSLQVSSLTGAKLSENQPWSLSACLSHSHAVEPFVENVCEMKRDIHTCIHVYYITVNCSKLWKGFSLPENLTKAQGSLSLPHPFHSEWGSDEIVKAIVNAPSACGCLASHPTHKTKEPPKNAMAEAGMFTWSTKKCWCLAKQSREETLPSAFSQPLSGRDLSQHCKCSYNMNRDSFSSFVPVNRKNTEEHPQRHKHIQTRTKGSTTAEGFQHLLNQAHLCEKQTLKLLRLLIANNTDAKVFSCLNVRRLTQIVWRFFRIFQNLLRLCTNPGEWTFFFMAKENMCPAIVSDRNNHDFSRRFQFTELLKTNGTRFVHPEMRRVRYVRIAKTDFNQTLMIYWPHLNEHIHALWSNVKQRNIEIS